MNKLLTFVGLACGLAVSGIATGATVSLPFVDGFEAYQVGTVLTNPANSAAGWTTVAENGTATVVNAAGQVLSGTKACFAEFADLTLSIDPDEYTNVWCQLFAKPSCYDDSSGNPDVDADVVAAFYVNTGGVLKAWSTDTWVTVHENINTSYWMGFVVHLDYASSNWDLYVTANNSYAHRLTKVNTNFALGFNAAAGHGSISNLVVEGSAYLDNVALSLGYTPVSNSYPYVATKDYTTVGSELIAISEYGYAWTANTSNTLNGELGLDLKSGLVPYNQLRIFGANSWNAYSLDALMDWQKDSGLDIDSFHIVPTMGIYVYRTNASASVAFRPYGETTDAVQETLAGYNNVLARGWNCLAWPDVQPTKASSSNLGFSDNGSLIFVHTNGSYRIFNMQSDIWREGSRPSGYVFTRGRAFWFFNNLAADTALWNIQNMNF